MKRSFVIRDVQIARTACEAVYSLRPDDLHEVVIKPYKSKRSLDQNALHWKRLDVLRKHLAESTGQQHSAEELHDWFKTKFLDVRLIEVGCETLKVQRTSAALNVKEFTEFMDHIDRWCIEHLHLYLPQPGQEDY